MTSADTPRLLLAEDNPAISLVLSDTAMDAGFDQVDCFATCREIWAYLEENTPALAVLDLCLQDGFIFEIARELQAKGVPIIFYSSHGAVVCEGTRFDGVPFFEKPYPIKGVLAEWLGRLRQAA